VLNNIPGRIVPDATELTTRVVVRILPVKTALGAVPHTNIISLPVFVTQQAVVFALRDNAFSQQGGSYLGTDCASLVAQLHVRPTLVNAERLLVGQIGKLFILITPPFLLQSDSPSHVKALKIPFDIRDSL
jgi:hypothetical protein